VTATIRLQEPFIDGDRRIYPVVSCVSETFSHGTVGSLLPLALIIEEGTEVSCVLLGGDSLGAILEKLVAAYS
jgi:hypothetical protein